MWKVMSRSLLNIKFGNQPTNRLTDGHTHIYEVSFFDFRKLKQKLTIAVHIYSPVVKTVANKIIFLERMFYDKVYIFLIE